MTHRASAVALIGAALLGCGAGYLVGAFWLGLFWAGVAILPLVLGFWACCRALAALRAREVRGALDAVACCVVLAGIFGGGLLLGNAIARVQSQRVAERAATAVKAFRSQHGRWPTTAEFAGLAGASAPRRLGWNPQEGAIFIPDSADLFVLGHVLDVTTSTWRSADAF